MLEKIFLGSIEGQLVVVAFLLLLCIATSRVTNLIGIPGLLVFLAIGMLAGSEGPGGIHFTNVGLAQNLGVIALASILFSGGFETDWKRVRSIFWSGFSLATLGVGCSAALVAIAAHWLLYFDAIEALLLGAVVSSTDAAAVFSILRSRNIGLKNRLGELLELESGSNDPMAIFITVILIQVALEPNLPGVSISLLFFKQMLIGAVCGLVAGWLTAQVVNRGSFDSAGLYPVLTFAAAALTYGATTQLGGNGFLAVYIAGIALGNSELVQRRMIRAFHDGFSWLMQLAMFLTLGLLSFPSEVSKVSGVGIIIAIVLMCVARPLSVFIALALTKFTWREKLFISWVGLRGAAPIILGTFPLLAGVNNAALIFNVVFFVVILSVLVQGPLLVPVARMLGLLAPNCTLPEDALTFEPGAGGKNTLLKFTVAPTSLADNSAIANLELPAGALVALVQREREYIVPRGQTELKAGDLVIVLAERESTRKIRAVFELNA